MLEQHINANELQQKILLLFEYRLFPELMAKSDHNNEAKDHFYQDLVALQTSIYHLDAHLEANWQTDIDKLNWHWQNIKNNLYLFNIDNEQTSSYLGHIKKYEKHELELRERKTPLRLDMEYFYFYKSCDVKLLRRLIYETFKLSPSCGNLSDWRYYDLVTEVNDDVEDLFEDLEYINGNRFLISLLSLGKKETSAIFTQFLNTIISKANEKYKINKGSFKSEIFDHTRKRVEETALLIHQQLDTVTTADLERSLLKQHLGISTFLV